MASKEEDRFAETVKRMLQTPHKPHAPLKSKAKRKPRRLKIKDKK
jgi:hypothetical protein